MKKILRCFLAFTVVLAAAWFVPVVADAAGGIKASGLTAGNYTLYENSDGTLYISSYSGDDKPTSLSLPSSAEGKKITAIASHAFSRISSSLKSVKIPNSIVNIQSYAFSNMEVLQKVELGSAVKNIGGDAFSNCPKLTTINLPDSLENLGSYAFSKCSSLKTITVPSALTRLEESTFRDCTNLATINIPSTLKDFGFKAFANTKWLADKRSKYSSKLVIVNNVLVDASESAVASITLPNGLEAIADCAYNSNEKVESIVIPNTVKKIGLAAFTFCTNLEKVTIPSSVLHIGGNAFDETKWLKNQQKKSPFVVVNNILINGDACKGAITIPSNVKKIGEWAFSQNHNITSVTIPSSVTLMEARAFGECDALKTVKIADGLTTISEIAFDHCSALTTINIPNTVKKIGQQAFYYCKALKSITIPNSVNLIDSAAFYSCEALTSLVLPNNAAQIRVCAFGYCTALKSLKIPAKLVLVGEAQFVGLSGLTTLTFEEGRKTISDYAFESCNNLTNLKLADSITEIGRAAFAGAPLSAELKLPKNLVTLSAYAFISCKNVKTISIYDKCKSINSYSFTPPDSTVTIRCYKDTEGDKYAKNTSAKIVYFNIDSERISGSNRYETAAKIAASQFPNGASAVVIASGVKYADALAGVPLATALKAPILLCDGKALDLTTQYKIKALKAKKAYILGGTGAVSADVANKLKALGLSVVRVSGKDRYETAVKIAKTMTKDAGKTVTSVFMVYGNNFPDAISASPAAGAKNAPILYVDKSGSLDTNTAKYLSSVKSDLKNAYIIGGYGTIGKAADTQVKKYCLSVSRISGSNRYSTCIAINNKFASTLSGTRILVTTAKNYPDALCAGVMAGLTKSPIVLADSSLNADQTNFLKKRITAKVTYIGGKNAVPFDMVYKINDAIKAGW